MPKDRPLVPASVKPGDKIGRATVLSVGRAKLPGPTGKAAKGTAGRSKLAEKFEAAWAIFGDANHPLTAEYQFHPERKWRFDFIVGDPSNRLAVEIDGGVHSGGRHVRGKGFEGDIDKLNEAYRLGWTVLRFTSTHLAKRRIVESLDILLDTLRKGQSNGNV